VSEGSNTLKSPVRGREHNNTFTQNSTPKSAMKSHFFWLGSMLIGLNRLTHLPAAKTQLGKTGF